MGFDPGDTLRSLLVIKIKQRHDSYTDQVSRIVVAKIFILCSIIISIDWFHDEMNCITPSGDTLPQEFIQTGCWVRGFYIYPHLANHMSESSYYGIPTDLRNDGYLESDESHLCQITTLAERFNSRKKDHKHCKPMVKEYFTQYQWMPFCVSFLGFLFYFPYMIFRIANTDMINLKHNLRQQVTAKQLVDSYFNHEINSITRNRVRTVANYIVKVLYIMSGVFGLTFLDWLTNYRFMSYGPEWINFARNSSSVKRDFKLRTQPTPGNRFLPNFAMCNLDDLRVDTTKSYSLSVTVVCEVSSHILFQYTFVVFWILIVSCICSSILGLIIHIFKHFYLLMKLRNSMDTKVFYRYIDLRGLEYLDFIRARDLTMYSEVLKLLNESVEDETTVPLTFLPSHQSHIDAKTHEVSARKPTLRHLDSIISEA
ncbi:innexin inx3-like [Clytia hemisphaerica]|uniref:innexin inx3-like n=1 Tax=Clytia hemisphaerica TaxID=252671 RepID=UPI0034D71438